MSILTSMHDRIGKDKFRNNYIGENVGVTSFEDKVTTSSLEWFQCVQLRIEVTFIRQVDKINV